MMEMARLLRLSEAYSVTMVFTLENSAPRPSPVKTRSSASSVRPCASPENSMPIVIVVSPPSTTARRPRMSASGDRDQRSEHHAGEARTEEQAELRRRQQPFLGDSAAR